MSIEDGKQIKNRIRKSNLYFEIESTQIPIIYSQKYNISLFGMERLHPFDAHKWGNVAQLLIDKGLVTKDYILPKEATVEDLKVVHTSSYLRSLNWSFNVAQITEVPPAAMLPNCILQKKILKPFRYQTGGTILAGKCAIEKGWSINLGGGFHHCSAKKGGGFCAYADITLCIRFLQWHHPEIKRIMIIDLDAHQGNGHERDFIDENGIYILDIYNKYIYPNDTKAKSAITRRVELSALTPDEEYLRRVEIHVEGALNEFNPNFVLYNAGTDILVGDPLGMLCVSEQGIIDRDEIVWHKVRSRGIPIVMVTSGGYLRRTAAIIADSICNLQSKGLLQYHQPQEVREENLNNCPSGVNSGTLMGDRGFSSDKGI